ncbi:MAG: Zn-dependent hydrolase, glyoxylase [Bacteroidetes bacterium]|nr:Zn-dependent hydrolase, glyoxylase [Bacteroidota bacterium]
MKVKQLYTNCLAQGAYYISHNGEAAIIDPLRETAPYLELLKQNNDTLKYIFETHFHADFVSGHVDLANATGAKIVFGPNAETSYNSYTANDNEEFKIGQLTLKVLHTPGHTLESSCYLLTDINNKPHCIFTGDTLFIGDVGRPDLAIKSTLTQEDLAGMLYDSLRNKIMHLPDDTIVYPAHGAGSACGKNMSKETFDTLGNQKKTNYALQNISKKDFVYELTTGITPAPQYFSKNALLNKSGYKNYEDVINSGAKALDVSDFEKALHDQKTLVLDVRKPEEFAARHIPNSIYVGLDGQFAPWVGTVIEHLETPILIIAPEGREAETVMRLSRVGYDNCIGFLKGGFDSWEKAGKKTARIDTVNADQYIENYSKGIETLDVRKKGEYDTNHLENTHNKPLDFIYDWLNDFNKDSTYYINCAGGYRSVIAASVLKSKGFKNLVNVVGGFGAIEKTGVTTCKSTCAKS